MVYQVMNKIIKAIADFQQEVPVICKDNTGYSYQYADLPTIFETINPILKKHGLGFYQAVNGTQIKTVVFHIESGETIESNTDIPQGVQLKGMNDYQVLGSGITYLRRYSLSSLLGIVADKDEDMAGKQKKVENIDVGPKLTPEEAFKKAESAMKATESLEDLNTVNQQVLKSKIITTEKKQELSYLYSELSEQYDPTK